MRNFLVASVSLVVAWPAVGGEAVSSAFTLDLHYEPSGEVFPGGAGVEVWGLSPRWTAMTTDWATDSNGDGIPDWWEQQFGASVGGLPAIGDVDGDGRTNIQEYNAGTNPMIADDYLASVATSGRHVVDTWIESSGGGAWNLVEVWCLSAIFATDTAGRAPDSDKDGIPDWWEIRYGMNPGAADAYLDLDGDGRTNLQEYNAGTDPTAPDDWLASISESNKSFETDTRVWYTGSNPTFDQTFAVVKVSQGFICDTGGLYYDWDGDGIPNWWEARFSRSGSKTALSAGDDDDGDGMSNYGEFVAYTDPTNVNSNFTISIVPIASGSAASQHPARLLSVGSKQLDGPGSTGLALRWQSAKGRVYSVLATDNLANGFGKNPVAQFEGTGADIEYDVGEVSGARFFKVEVVLP